MSILRVFIFAFLLFLVQNNYIFAKNTFVFDFEHTISQTVVGFDLIREIGRDYNLSHEMDVIIDEEIENMKKIGTSPMIYRNILTRMSSLNLKVKQSHFDRVIKITKLAPNLDIIIQNLIKNGHQVIIIGGGYGGCNTIAKIANKFGVYDENVFSGRKLKINTKVKPENQEGYNNCKTGEVFVDPSWSKSNIINILKKRGKITGKKIIHIGDGENDLEVWTSGAVDQFIGFGINKINERVLKKAPVFVKTNDEFLNVLKKYE